MSSDQKESVIRRKAQSGLNVHQARAMSVQKALRVSLAKVADELFDMAMSAIGVTSETLNPDECAALFDSSSLLVLLDGPDRRVGAAVVDSALVGALIQQQTMGKVHPVPDSATPRVPTGTDAAMCAPFLDELLVRAAKLLETEEELRLLEGYRFGSRADDSRLVMMALDEPEYRALRLTIDIAGGCRQGKLDLLVPLAPVAQVYLEPVENGAETGQAPAPKSLVDMVMSLNADLTIALTRMRLPLSRITGLAVGDTVTLNINNLDEAIVLGADGKQISLGRLGQVDGMRALKVEPPKRKGITPQRRAGDRSAVEQPDVAPFFEAPEMDEFKLNDLSGDWKDDGNGTLPDLPGLPDLPDMSDLPEVSGFGDLPELLDLPNLELKVG